MATNRRNFFARDFKTSGFVLGYTTLIVRASILLCLIFSLINVIIYDFYRKYNDDIERQENNETGRNYYFHPDFMPRSMFWILSGIIIFFAFGTVSSVCLILGVKLQYDKLLLPYLMMDTLITVGCVIIWFMSLTYVPYAVCATISLGEFEILFIIA